MVDTYPFDVLERSLDAVLRLLSERATAGDLAQQSGYDLPPASWALLEHLDAHGALRVSDIAACHGVDVSSITPRLKKLEGTGLVQRERVAADARSFLISITVDGATALESIHAARRHLLAQALTGTESAKLSHAAEVLQSIVVQLSQRSFSPEAR